MTNGDEPATGFAALLENYESVYKPGLTKREYFAAMAMQGRLVNSKKSYDEDAIIAVKQADALINELNKEVKKEEINTYTLVAWPDSQLYMEAEWFKREAILAQDANIPGSSYFIPTKRLL